MESAITESPIISNITIRCWIVFGPRVTVVSIVAALATDAGADADDRLSSLPRLVSSKDMPPSAFLDRRPRGNIPSNNYALEPSMARSMLSGSTYDDKQGDERRPSKLDYVGGSSAPPEKWRAFWRLAVSASHYNYCPCCPLDVCPEMSVVSAREPMSFLWKGQLHINQRKRRHPENQRFRSHSCNSKKSHKPQQGFKNRARVLSSS